MYDVAVIGGGVNGTGIARDCALRGLRVLLVEKHDLGSGASGASSGMIHGGLRYLRNDIVTTRRACLDSGYIQAICPHLLFRIPFLMLVPRGKKIFLELVETYLEAYDWFAPLKRGKPHIRLTRGDIKKLEPAITDNIEGGVLFDEWGIDAFRLCVLNALAAKEHGADIRTHTALTGFVPGGSPENFRGLVITDALTGRSENVQARCVVNATGAWLPAVARMAGLDMRIRPGKGIHLVLDRRVSNIGVLFNAIDGRSIFLIPHENASLLGTTDDDYYGDLDRVRATHDEVEYLLEGFGRAMPGMARARVTTITAGVRNTLYAFGPNEDDLSREHLISTHTLRGGSGAGGSIEGIVSFSGGKLASYRLQSEEVTDAVCRVLGVSRPCRTHQDPLPGSRETLSPLSLADAYGIHPTAAVRLVYRHGDRARQILELTRSNPSWKNMVCVSEPVLEAEIRWCIREEWARTVHDIRNRTRLAFGPCQGMECAGPAAAILADELGRSAAWAMEEWKAFTQLAREERAPALRGAQMAQEEVMEWVSPR